MAGVGVGAGVGKLWPTPTPVRSRTTTRQQTIILAERLSILSKTGQDEKEGDSVQIKLKRHLWMEFCLIKVSEIILGPSLSFYDCVNAFKD